MRAIPRLVALLVVVLAMPARADIPSSALVVTEGPTAAELARDALSKVDGWRAADSAAAPPPKSRLGTPPYAASVVEGLRSSAREAHADAVLVVVVVPTGRARQTTSTVIDARSDGAVTSKVVRLGKKAAPGDGGRIADSIRAPLDRVRDAMGDAKGSAASAAAGASAASPTTMAPTTMVPTATPSASASTGTAGLGTGGHGSLEYSAAAPGPSSDDPPRTSLDAMLVLSGGLELLFRQFSYNDALSPNLRGYGVAAAPSAFLGAAVYPFVATELRWLHGLGIFGEMHTTIGLSSETADSPPVPTAATRAEGGISWRQTFGTRTSPWQLLASGSYGRESVGFAEQVADYPAVAYAFVRGSLGVRIPLGKLSLTPEAAYVGVLSGGEVASRFRETRVAGVEGALTAAIPFARALGVAFEARPSVSYTHYFYSFKPEPGDASVAGGALDQFLRFKAAVAVIY